MSIQALSKSDTLENGQMTEQLSEVCVHSCSDCGLHFNKLVDLELHNQLHDKSKYKCLLCNEVFTDFEQLKLHDLRHSLEEADEDVADIEQMILPFGLKSCDICSEKFSCDEELINHFMNHSEEVNVGMSGEKFSRDDELPNELGIVENDILPELELNEDSLLPHSEDEQTRYQILRQEVVKNESGTTDIRFILIDHQNEKVEEYTHTIHKRTKQTANVNGKSFPKSNSKKNKSSVKSKKVKKPETVNKKIKSKVSLESDDDSVVEDSVRKKLKKSDSDDEVMEFESEITDPNNRSRRSKLLALKRKIWNTKIHLPPPLKLKECHVCNKSFGGTDDFKKHLLTHKSEPEEQSTSLSATNKKNPLKQEKNRNKRMPLKDGENDDYPEWIEIVCEICDNRFCRKKGLRKHLIKVHKLDLTKVNYYLQKVQYNTATYYTCKTCKKQFYRESRLHSHGCVPAIAVVCDICDKKLSSKYALEKHLAKSHKLGEKKVSAVMEQLVGYNVKFYKKLDPVDEVAVSSSDGRLVTKKKGTKFNILRGPRCDKCFKTLADKRQLGHRCASKIEIKCEVCSYTSPSKYNLKRHLMRLHKISLSEAEKVLSEFKCYNERLILRYSVANREKKEESSPPKSTDTKSPVLKTVSSSKKIISHKSKSVASLKKSNLKSAQNIKARAKATLLNKGKKRVLNEKNKTKKVSNKASPSSKKTSSPPSKKPNLSISAEKKDKMKQSSKSNIKKVVAKKLVDKSRNYFGKNGSLRRLRSRV